MSGKKVDLFQNLIFPQKIQEHYIQVKQPKTYFSAIKSNEKKIHCSMMHVLFKLGVLQWYANNLDL